MPIEVDFLPVGSGSKSGDAIALRWRGGRDLLGHQRVMVIDGGTKESGKALAEHINSYYGTNRVDYVVSTHCDSDHASGLVEIVNNCEVGQLLMHRPWKHAGSILRAVVDGRVTKASLTRRLSDDIEAARNLCQAAEDRQIPIFEPFAGSGLDGPGWTIRILGPSLPWYKQQLAQYRGVPDTKPALSQFNPIPGASSTARHRLNFALAGLEPDSTFAGPRLGSTGSSPLASLLRPNANQALDDSGDTSAENESSVVLWVEVDGHAMLFTGDAGMQALHQAINCAIQKGLDFSRLGLLQVPHHGSEHNLGPSVLNRLNPTVAVVSAAPNGAPSHPSSKVINALLAKRCVVYATQGLSLRHSLGLPARFGWVPARPLTWCLN